MEHEIITGKRGGKYWIDDKGRKHYITQQGPVAKPKKNVNRLPNPSTQKIHRKHYEAVEATNEPITYIGYFYQLDKDGNRIDDFKEWCKAYNKQDAREEFEDRYWRAIEEGTIELSMVCAER